MLWECPCHVIFVTFVTRVTRVKVPGHGECHSECTRQFVIHHQATAPSWRESLATHGAFIEDPGDDDTLLQMSCIFFKSQTRNEYTESQNRWFDHVVTRNARRIGWFNGHPVDDYTLLWMSDIFLKSHRPEWTIGWRLAGMGLFRTHQVTLSWVGPELISNNIILDIIPRLSKAASDTKFDILPQFTYTYAFNLPQTPNFLALTLTNSSLSPRQENIYSRTWCEMSLYKRCVFAN